MRSILLNIEKQIRLAFLLISFFSVIGGLFSYFLLKKVSQYHDTEKVIGKVVNELQEARKSEKDFMLYDSFQEEFYRSGKSENIAKHKGNISRIKNNLKNLSDNKIIIDLGLTTNLHSIKSSIIGYERGFKKLINAKLKRGFKDFGLVGMMRDQVHDLQKCISPEEQVFAYSLRRHEKDFFLRRKLSYHKKLKNTATEFKEMINNSSLPHINTKYKKHRIETITNYVKHFDKIVDIDTKIGLENTSGLRGELTLITSEIEPLVEGLYMATAHKSEITSQNALIVLATSIILLFILGILFSFYIASKISKPIIKLNNITKTIIKGERIDYNKFNDIETNNEIKNLASNFKQMLQQLDEKISQVNTKNTELEKNSIADKTRKWKIEGLNEISKKIKSSNHEINTICKEVLSFIVKYTDSISGSFYVLDDKTKIMSPTAHYATSKLRVSVKQNSFGKGEELVGQVWEENDAIFLSDIPENYKAIETSICHLKPRNIILAPISSDSDVEGVIELASLSELTKAKRDFIETAAKELFQAIKSIKINLKTNLLLQESNTLAGELKASEEELRQNMEELQATQDEMVRVSEIKNLKISKIQLKSKIYKYILKQRFKKVLITDDNFNINYLVDSESVRLTERKKIDQNLIETIRENTKLKSGKIQTYFCKKIFSNEDTIYDNFSVLNYESKDGTFYVFMIQEKNPIKLNDLESLSI